MYVPKINERRKKQRLREEDVGSEKKFQEEERAQRITGA